MSLSAYHKKRNFKKTAEPSGSARKTPAQGRGGKLRFVIQKHAASRLHYDFRIEVDGVMMSWAVPKGPSMNPEDKRLAMLVEDHPLEYRKFEGTIPKGEYGGGTVMIWDEGTYHIPTTKDPKITQKVVKEEFKRGDIKITLHGQKIKGEFAIVKVKSEKFGENAWLMIKHKDEYVNEPIPNADLSVVSGRTMEEIAAGISGSGNRAGVREDKASRKKDPRPKNITPMLASLTETAFDDPDWLFEIKWDGYRAIADIKNGETKLTSRNQLGFNAYYPALVRELNGYEDKDMILDGEVVVVDEEGKPSFQLLQNYRKTQEGNLIYYVFDILYYDGKDLRKLPLRERKEILQACLSARQAALPQSDIVKLSDFVWERGREFLLAATKQGLEGIIAKRGDSKYLSGVRNHRWLKIKTAHRQEFVIVGYTSPAGAREDFGALALAVHDKKKLVYAGLVGTGFTRDSLKELKQKLHALETDKMPFAKMPEIPNLESWVKPKLVAEIEFREWTDDGLVRQASFQGLREDKNELDVKREKASPVSREARATLSLRRGAGGEASYTNLDKLFWPQDKVTKGDLIEYFEQISPVLLPYLKDRPQNLNRFPHGIKGESFFQKDMDQDLPKFVSTVNIYSESNDREIRYMLCQNKETLMYMGNLACLEINPWNSRVSSIDQPDYVLFDLDPEDIDFEEVVKAALALHKLLDEVKAPNFIKTSGKRGLHVYVPLDAKYSFEQAQQFAQLIGMLLRERLPDLISLERSPNARQGKVYIDYLQNRKGQTTAGVYSPRPVKGATVSTPLDWDEVTKRLDPQDYNMKNIFKRIDKLGDMWKGMRTKSFDMARGLAALGES